MEKEELLKAMMRELSADLTAIERGVDALRSQCAGLQEENKRMRQALDRFANQQCDCHMYEEGVLCDACLARDALKGGE